MVASLPVTPVGSPPLRGPTEPLGLGFTVSRPTRPADDPMYLWLKLAHVAAVIVFLGNVLTQLFWHAHAARTRDPRLLAHTMAGVIRTDRVFTLPGIAVILVTGVALAMVGRMPIVGTPWILWTLLLFGLAGIVFGARIAPLQRRLLGLALAGAGEGAFDEAGYRRLTAQWERWGGLAVAALLAGLALMTLKPTL